MLILIVLASVAMIVWQRYRVRAAADRQRQLADWARARGWHYRTGDGGLVRHWSGPPFVGGGWAGNVFTGEVEGRAFTAFEYGYEEGSGDNTVTRRFQVTTVALPAALPMLWIAPETGFDRLSQRLGSQDIDFESAEFNRAFTVRADDERYAHAVIHPRMMEYLLRSPARWQSIRIEGSTLLMWESGELSTDRLLVNVGTLAQIAALIPGHTLEQHAIAEQPAEQHRFAGSVTGVRPEPTLGGLLRPAFLLLWSLLWCGLTLPVALAVLASQSALDWSGLWNNWPLAAIVFLFPLIGVAVAIIALTRLIRGFIAIRLNKRDRDRRLLSLPNPDRP